MKDIHFNKGKMVVGRGSLDTVRGIDGRRFFVVTGQHAMIANGTIDRLKKIFREDNKAYDIYTGITANPTVDAVLNGTERMKEFDPDVVLAVGGGSAIDAAKVMALLCDYPDLTIEEIRSGNAPTQRRSIILAAAPSTSGTASEVTQAAVLTFVDEDLKVGLKTPAFIPDIAIVDGDLTLSMPKKVAAESGMDALTHALECYTSKKAEPICKAMAKVAAEGIFKWLPISFESGDPEARERVHEYQALAGIAFTNAGLGMDHGIAHAFGGKYDYGHGLLNAVGLPYVLEYNSRDPEVSEELSELSRIIKGDVIEKVKEMRKQFGIPNTFAEMGLLPEDFNRDYDELLENSLKGSTQRNPVPMNAESMDLVLKSIFDGKIRFTEE